MIAVYLAAPAGTMAAQAAPGPRLLAVAGMALALGRAHAIRVAAGVATGVLVWVAAFALGILALFELYPLAGGVLLLAGGGYLIAVAARALTCAATRTPVLIGGPARPASAGGAYRRGLFVVLTNPKAAMMWAAVTAFLSDSGLGPVEVLMFAPLGAFTALLIYGGYGVLFSSRAAQGVYRRAARWFELSFGPLFGVMGVKLILDGWNAVRA